MSWSYRLIHSTQESLNGEKEEHYEVVEMFEDANGKPNGWGSASPSGSTVDEVYEALQKMQTAHLKPVIEVCGECHNIAPAHKPDCSRTERLTVSVEGK